MASNALIRTISNENNDINEKANNTGMYVNREYDILAVVGKLTIAEYNPQ